MAIESNEPSDSVYNGIATIPPELLIEIFKLSDYRVILSARQACKTFYRITTTKVIWISIFWKSVHNNPPKTFALERPIDDYSSKELERVVLAYESTKVGWRTDDGVPSRQREIVTNGNVNSAYLVPGGRWLLGIFLDGRIGYYDLECQGEIEENELVPAQIAENDLNLLKTTVDIDNTLPMTSFNLAMYLREVLNYQAVTYNGIKIWTIKFVLEGSSVVGLKATCLKYIPMDQEWISHIHSISLLDRHLAFSAQANYPANGATFVVEWPDIVDGSLDFPRKLVGTLGTRSEMHLLPKQKVISACRDIVELSDYSTIEETRSVTERPPSAARVVTPLWKHEFRYFQPTNLSLPLRSRDDNHIRVMALTPKVLYDINITDLDQPFSPNHVTINPLIPTPVPTKIYTFTGVDGAAHGLGHERGVLYAKCSPDLIRIHLLEYQTGVETPEFVPVAKTAKYLGRIIHRPHFDPGSGRLVACFAGHLEVIDFALIYKNL